MESDLGDEEETGGVGSGQQTGGKFSRNVRDSGGLHLGGLAGLVNQTAFEAGGSQPAATFFVDMDNSFASLVWLGLEWDLLVMELLLLLNIDTLLGPDCLTLTVGSIWLINKLFQSVYSVLARRNLIITSMLDEKFLFLA